MNQHKVAGFLLAGLPSLAIAQTPSPDVQEMQRRQEVLERQLSEQNARIAELERLLKQMTGAQVPALPATPATPAVAAQPAPAPQPAAVAQAEAAQNPAVRLPAANPGPEYIGNLGFKIYESDKGQIYMRLFSYARYLNQKGLDSSYTDYFGNTFNIDLREDFQLNKFFLPFSGWFLDPKFKYYLYVWSANTAQGDPAQVVGAGNVSWAANEHFTFGMGITSLPSVRSTEGQFPYWLGVDDRLTADEFFRGSYTTGIWAKGAIVPGVNYMAMWANNLSTLGISSAQLDDTPDTYSAMLSWMPTTKEFGPIGAFGDFENHQEFATRFGIHYTQSTEDAQSQPGSNTIENSQIRLTDGSQIFTRNLFGPGINVDKVDYQMASLDAGFKYLGYAVEAEVYRRRLSDYVGPGTDIIPSITDNGYQLQLSAMLVQKLFQVYGGLSEIRGDYGDSMEVRAGFNYFPKRMRGIRVNGEWINLDDSPVGYQAVPYVVGGNGNLFHVNFEINF